jgi:hypothetical protein
MSDYEVTLVNDCMQEFYVRFYGPAESMLTSRAHTIPNFGPNAFCFSVISTICRRRVENPRRAARSVPFQIAQYWIHEQDISS